MRRLMHRIHRFIPVAIVLVAIALSIGLPPASAETYPLSLTDDAGRVVSFDRPPERIISLEPSNTEILFGVGAGDQVVGVDEFSNYPPGVEEKATVGTMLAPSYEVIVGLDPDLIIVTDVSGEHAERLMGLGYPVLHVSPDSLEAIFDWIETIGAVVGHASQAEALAEELRSQVDDIVRQVGVVTEADRPKVFYEVWDDPLMTAGPGSFIHEVIEVAGGVNIAADAPSAWPLFSLETVVERNPDIILTTFTDTVDALLSGGRPAWNGIGAVGAGRVYLVDEDEISRPGPRIVRALKSVARAIHPDLFE